ncbi:hypothetical protein Gotur_005594 [Gossypium turneri]
MASATNLIALSYASNTLKYISTKTLNESKSNGLHSERGIDDRDAIASSFIVKNVQFLITKDILGFMEVANRESSQGYFLKIVNSSEKFEEVYPIVLIKKNKHVEVHDSYWFPLLAMERNNGVVLVGLPNKITFGLITMMNDGCVSTENVNHSLGRYLLSSFSLLRA